MLGKYSRTWNAFWFCKWTKPISQGYYCSHSKIEKICCYIWYFFHTVWPLTDYKKKKTSQQLFIICLQQSPHIHYVSKIIVYINIHLHKGHYSCIVRFGVKKVVVFQSILYYDKKIAETNKNEIENHFVFFNILDNSACIAFALFLKINPAQHMYSFYKRRILIEKLGMTLISHNGKKYVTWRRVARELV